MAETADKSNEEIPEEISYCILRKIRIESLV